MIEEPSLVKKRSCSSRDIYHRSPNSFCESMGCIEVGEKTLLLRPSNLSKPWTPPSSLRALLQSPSGDFFRSWCPLFELRDALNFHLIFPKRFLEDWESVEHFVSVRTLPSFSKVADIDCQTVACRNAGKFSSSWADFSWDFLFEWSSATRHRAFEGTEWYFIHVREDMLYDDNIVGVCLF